MRGWPPSPLPVLLAALAGGVRLAIPVTHSVLIALRLAVTADRLVGRVESARSTLSLLVAPLGLLAAGLMLDGASARVAVGALAALGAALAVWATAGPAMRSAPERAASTRG